MLFCIPEILVLLCLPEILMRLCIPEILVLLCIPEILVQLYIPEILVLLCIHEILVQLCIPEILVQLCIPEILVLLCIHEILVLLCIPVAVNVAGVVSQPDRPLDTTHGCDGLWQALDGAVAAPPSAGNGMSRPHPDSYCGRKWGGDGVMFQIVNIEH